MNNQYRFSLDIPKKNGAYCLFGVPESNHYQIIKKFLCNPKPAYAQTINLWNNHLLIFLLKNVQDKITVSFSARPLGIKKNIDSSLLLDDYRNNKTFPDHFINGKDGQIKQQAKNILQNERSILVISQKLYQHTLKHLTYGRPIPGLYSYSQVLQNQTTDCGGFSTYLLSLFQSIGIPGRLVVGFVIKKNICSRILSLIKAMSLNFSSLSMHAWIEIQLPDETWFPMDPAMEWRRTKKLTKRLGGFGMIPDDRLVISFGEDFEIEIDKTKYAIDILQHPKYL